VHVSTKETRIICREMRDDELEVGGEGGSPTLLPHPLPTDKNSGLISETIFFLAFSLIQKMLPAFRMPLSFQSDFHVLLKIRQLQELCFRFFFSKRRGCFQRGTVSACG
jgi:hypothetical protein